MTDLTLPRAGLRYPSTGSRISEPDWTLTLPGRASMAVYAVCALPFVIGAAAGYTSYGLIGSLVLAIIASAVAGVRWLLPVFFAFLPFQQSIVPSNVNVACSDLISAALFVALMPRIGRLRFGLETVALAMYLLISAIASATTLREPFTFVSLARMATATLVPLLAFGAIDSKGWSIARSFAFYIASTTILACFVMFNFTAHGIEKAMYTLDLHKNAMGTTFAVAVVIIVGAALLIWNRLPRGVTLLLLGINSLALLMTLSRSGWLACACGIACMLLITKRLKVALMLSIPAITAVVIAWQFIPEDRREYAANVSLTAGTVKTRLQSMNEVMAQFRDSPLMGVGVGLRKYVEPHNMFVLNLGETGIVGTSLLLVALGLSFRTLLARRPLAGAQIAERTVVRTIGTAVLLATIVHGTFDVYWRRGVSAAGWAVVGMVLATGRRPEVRRPLLR